MHVPMDKVGVLMYWQQIRSKLSGLVGNRFPRV
jgi:hypothetical protein